MDDNWPWFDINNPMNIRLSERMTIDELEKLLNSDSDEEIEILPNGEVRKKGASSILKVLTMRDNLGGEYATCG